MSKASDAANGFGVVLFFLWKILAVLIHLFFCFYAYLTGSFLAIILTFMLPVASEIYWLIDAYKAVGFFWLHYIVFGWVLMGIFAFILISLDGSRAEERKLRKRQKKQQAQILENDQPSRAAEAVVANRRAMERQVIERSAKAAQPQPPVIIPQPPVSQEEQLRRRAELAERRCQELSAELREQKEKSQADILTVQIEELERSLAMNQTLPPDGIADLNQELIERKARLFDLQRKQQ